MSNFPDFDLSLNDFSTNVSQSGKTEFKSAESSKELLEEFFQKNIYG
jgi:hypothetical protein